MHICGFFRTFAADFNFVIMSQRYLLPLAALCLLGCNHAGNTDDPTIYSVASKSYSYTNAEDINIYTATADELDGKILIRNHFDFKKDSVEIVFRKDTIKKTSETHADLFGFSDTLRCSFTQDGNSIYISGDKRSFNASAGKDCIIYHDTIYTVAKVVEL